MRSIAHWTTRTDNIILYVWLYLKSLTHALSLYVHIFLGDSCEINIDECTRLVEIVSEFKGGARNIIEISKSSSVNGSILFRMIRLSRFTPFHKRQFEFRKVFKKWKVF